MRWFFILMVLMVTAESQVSGCLVVIPDIFNPGPKVIELLLLSIYRWCFNPGHMG